MVVVTSIISPSRTPEGKMSQNCSLSSPSSRPPAYNHYAPEYDRHGTDMQRSQDGSVGYSSTSAQCVPSDSHYDSKKKLATPVPFPPRRPKIPHNRSTMVPVSRYVQKTPFMIYDLARVRALWVHEEQTMTYLHGTPAQPLKDSNMQLKHNCRHCQPPPLHFFSSCNDQGYGANDMFLPGKKYVATADMMDSLPDVDIEIAAVPDDMETECELDEDMERCGSPIDDMMALDNASIGALEVVSTSA